LKFNAEVIIKYRVDSEFLATVSIYWHGVRTEILCQINLPKVDLEYFTVLAINCLLMQTEIFRKNIRFTYISFHTFIFEVFFVFVGIKAIGQKI
jgi:hypothetical protein